MNLYALLLIAIIVLQVLLAIFVLIYKEDVKNAAFKGWQRLWSGRVQSGINARVIDQIQQKMECCGSTSFLDYQASIPMSCCNPESFTCNQLTSYKIGCRTQIGNYFDNYSPWIAYLSIFMAIFEVSESEIFLETKN